MYIGKFYISTLYIVLFTYKDKQGNFDLSTQIPSFIREIIKYV